MPTGQVATHVRCEQNGVAPEQTLPQAPQFIASDTGLTHAVPHASSPPVQAQALLTQVCPTPQRVLHMPQWLKSVVVVTQTLPQLVCPLAQDDDLPAEPPVGLVPALAPPEPALPALGVLPLPELPFVIVSTGPAPQLASSPRHPMNPKANTLRMRHLLVDPRRPRNPFTVTIFPRGRICSGRNLASRQPSFRPSDARRASSPRHGASPDQAERAKA